MNHIDVSEGFGAVYDIIFFSRGLDIPTVDLVINENVPFVPKEYIHRVGRTARAGRGGMSITMVTQYDIPLMHKIENKISNFNCLTI